ncbi:MAG: ddl [Gammaproteobacteria bacterium]|jgi:D-alanine-D-alanine ligase|nr:ddl [Gammaproteobacteria bacterium]
MKSKINIAVLLGGQSSEHEVSIESAKNVIQALDPKCYQTHVIFINRQGEWFLMESPQAVLDNPHMQPMSDLNSAVPLGFQPGHRAPFFLLSDSKQHLPIDVIFPVLHGAHGEDGTLQGMLELLNIPYVGAGVLGSSIAMDKEFAKRQLKASGIPVSDWIVIYKDALQTLDFDSVVRELGLPLFVKPVRTGSSVGVSKVKNREAFDQALKLAAQYDDKILLETYIPGREIECAVLGNHAPEASLPGEIIPHHEFYSYDAKYLDPEGASLKMPAELDKEIIERIQEMAKKSFVILGCEGMARIDFFLTSSGELVVNEANTIPGFTQISMYPKLWDLTGLPYPALMDRLIDLAFERHAKRKMLELS